MAKYPTNDSVRADFSDEQLDDMIPGLPKYLTDPVPLVSLAMDRVTPQIIVEWGALAEAVRLLHPDVIIKADSICRPLSRDELRDKVVSRIAADRYDAAVKAEKASETTA